MARSEESKSIEYKLLKDLSNVVYKEKRRVDSETVRQLRKKFEELKSLVSKDFYLINENKYYISYFGKIKLNKLINEADIYSKAYKLVVEILDILRKDVLKIVIQKTVKDDEGRERVILYTIKESELETYLSFSEDKIDHTKSLTYHLKNMEKEITTSLSYTKHYENFRNIILDMTKKRDGKEYKKYNDGHIIEAYQRHIYMEHKGHNVMHDKFNEPIDKRKAIILFNMSINSDPWWVGGDIDMFQIKGDNSSLGSMYSIIVTTNKLVQMYDKLIKTNNTKDFIDDFQQAFIKRGENDLINFNGMSNEIIDKLFKQAESELRVDSKKEKNLTL